MRLAGGRIALCSCEGTMTIDGPALAKALGAVADGSASVIHRHLCRSQLDAYRAALDGDGPLIVACAQERWLFAEVAEAAGRPVPRFVDIRDRAGWSSQGASATAKMAALIAEAMETLSPTPAVTLKSEGRVVVLADDGAAMEVARRLAAERAVTLVLTTATDVTPPMTRSFAILSARGVRARGHLGAYVVTVTDPAALAASARGEARFDPPGPTRDLTTDIVLDLRAAPALLPDREGHIRRSVADAVGIETAIAEALALVGEFEKPRYIRFDSALCAHSRNKRVGCTRCLDACPSSAISPNGDHVLVDAAICAGHGACVTACPTGAVAFDFPADNGLHKRLGALVGTYTRAGGAAPILLTHEMGAGDEVLSVLARHGDGLPADVVPMGVPSVAALGLDFLLTAVSRGVAGVVMIADPARAVDLAPTERAIDQLDRVVETLGWRVPVTVTTTNDPDGVVTAIAENRARRGRGDRHGVDPASTHLVLGGKRATMTQALTHLRRHAPTPADEVAMPEGAPFGAVVLDGAKCTLCLSCVGVCPTGALTGHPDKPSLGFTEASCVQCGLCRVTCPEKVITLTPRLNLRDTARTRQVLKEEEPHLCPRCGKAFGTRASIDAMMTKLAAHPMFAGTNRLALIGLCEDCRVVAQYEGEEESRPFQLGAPRVPRTTDDYLREREDAKRMAAEAERKKE